MFYIFHGDDQESKKQEISRWIDAFTKKYGDTANLSILKDKINVASLLSECKTTPFLCDKRLIIVHELLAEINDEDLEKLESDLPNITDTTILVFVESDIKLTSKAFKHLKKIGEIREFQQSKPNLRKTAMKILEKENKKIGSNTLDELISNLHDDPVRLNNEIQKLILYAKNDEIKESDINEIVSFDSNVSVFKLMDTLSERNTKASLATLHSLYDNGEDLVRLFYLIARQIRLLIIAKKLSESGLSPNEISAFTGLKPFIVTKILKQIPKFKLQKLMDHLEQLLKIDIKIKTGYIKSPKSGFNEVLFELEKFIVKVA